MENILLLFVCLFLGLALRKAKNLPEKMPEALNQFVIYISLPALALHYIPQIELNLDLLFPILTSWIVLFLSMLVIPMFGRLFDWDRKTTGALLLTAGLGNTSFVGFPVIEALYGSEGMKIALLVDQPGSFVALTTLGVIIASVYSSGRIRKRVLVRKIFLFPPFITFLVAVVMNLLNLQAQGALLNVLETLGATIIPLALVSVGMQLRVEMSREMVRPLACGLAYKLLFAPALLYLLYVPLLGGGGLAVEVSIMEAAMAPMIAGSILAITYGLHPRLATLMVGIGVPLSFLTLTFWYFFLQWAL